MDYDDNDVSRHNLQLAGEGRTKSSSVLRPYDFPKFDFAESLQGNLKFDSLVETEVFLGIQSQEDSQWIEDFSRGSNGMEFNSTPADSCSILRKNNVWSEATSSESVEMLLKSVGQEETMPEESIILESSDDQGTLQKRGEPSGKKDETSDGFAANSEVTVPEDEFLKDDTPLKVLVEEQLPKSELPSATHICGKGETSINDRNHSYEVDNLRESKASGMSPGAGEESLPVADSGNYNAGAFSTVEASEQVNVDVSRETCDDEQDKHVSTGQEDFKSSEAKIGEASKDIHTVYSSLCSVTEFGVNNQGTVETRIDCVRETTERESEANSSEIDFKMSCEVSIETGKHEVKDSPASRTTGGPCEEFRDGPAANGPDQDSAELDSLDAVQLTGLKQKMDPCLQLTSRPDGDKMEDIPASSVDNDSITNMASYSSHGDKIAIKGCDYNNLTNASKSSDMPVLSCAAGNKRPENVKGCHSDSTVTAQEPGALLPIALKSHSNQVIEENPGQNQVDLSESEHDICRITEKNKKLPTNAEDMNSKNVGPLTADQMTQSVDLSKGVTINDDVCKLQRQTARKMELENVVSPLANRTTAGLEDDPENAQGEPAVRGSSHPDHDHEEDATRTESDVNFSTEGDSISKVKDILADDAARSPFSEIDTKSLQPPEKSNNMVSKFPSTEDMDPVCSNSLQVDTGCDKASLKESADANLVSRGNQDVKTLKQEGEKVSVQAAEVDKTSCGSPTIISSSEPSQVDKEQEGIRSSVDTDKFVRDNQSASEYAKPKDTLADDTSFTFKVNALPDTTEGEPGRSWSPFPNDDKCKSSLVVEEASPSVKCKPSKKTPPKKTPSKKTPLQSAQASDGELVHGTPKGTSERKGRRASAKGMPKENSKKGNKETGVIQESALTKGDKVSNTLLSISGNGPHVQFGMTQPYGSGAVAAPHLSTNNNSPSASSRQPFTDLQQVQLRAQIFVYGSLIQGVAPDEACMASAFGPSDGGRSIWEPVWRAAVDRVRSQKSNSPATETPLHSLSGAKASGSAIKQSSHSKKAPSSPVGRSNSKGTLATVVNPIIPLSSPLWSVSTPSCATLPSTGAHKGPTLEYSHAITPLHSYQTLPIKNFVGQTPWPQTCFPGPWIASPQASTFSSSFCFQPVTMAETVKLTPAKGASGLQTSSIKHVTSSPAAHTVEASPVFEGASLLPDSKPNASAEKHSVDLKRRKRKKVSGSDRGQASVLPEAQSEPVVLPNVASNLSSAVGVPAPASPAPYVLKKAAGYASTVSPIDCLKQGNTDSGKVVKCSEETMSKVAEAKNQAEDAAALATAAVNHSEHLSSQLAKQKESGLVSEAEVKLASAAAAITAAVSVAKAAAAAAKVAYSAVLQAKEMADEAFLSSKTSSSGRSYVDMHDIGNATPQFILKGDNITNRSNSILVAAKEAAKRRVEAASAASKQAENLDAIVKAAELAAAAVSQAGKIVAMGKPLPVSDLMGAGPEGYWKLPHPSPEFTDKMTDKNKEQAGTSDLGKGAAVLAKASGERSVERGGSETVGYGKTYLAEKLNDPVNGHVGVVDGITESMHIIDKGFKSSRDCKVSETAKSSGVVSQSDTTPRTSTAEVEHDEMVDSVPEDSINAGSLVEVFKHGDGFKSAWYSANVLRLEDGKAYVCYSDLLSEQGSANLCEWVTLEGEGDNAPIIRGAHPSTTLPFQATRKRRRGTLGDYAWSVGDRVDVWIDDCWWEGVVTEKKEKDETTLQVHFPAQGETSTVRAWNLRTSRTWKDGKWVEWSSSRGNNASEQGDTPEEKRRKLGSAVEPTNGKDKLASDLDSGSGKPGESDLLPLSTSDRTFNIGKSTRKDNKRAGQRTLRSGQQKEGSRVVFGVPKPTGKKRKFVEVSKHFPATRSDKSNETTDFMKFTKYLVPQPAASRGWKAPLRNDSKEKQTAESRSRVPNSRKSNRTLPPRDNLNATLTQDNSKLTDNGNDIQDSVVQDENTSEKLVEPGSSACEGAPEVPLSSLIASTLSASSKKTSSSNTRSERVHKGNLAPSGGKLSKIAEEKVYNGNDGNSVSEAIEPRRSNRRIQPTHRLLEGLQSSMTTIPKMPSVSHDRGSRNPSRNVPTKGK